MSNPGKQTLWLSYFTVYYNIIEGLVSVFIGSISGSISLVGFGLDSFIESLSGSVLIWRFHKSSVISKDDNDKLEQKAIRLISYTFFVLGSYVFFQAAKKLYFHEPTEQSLFGIVIALISIIVMIGLYKKKQSVGKSNHIRSLVADSKQTLACIWMSVTMLIGLGFHYLFNIWWADGVSGIIIAAFLFKEGYNTYKERALCDC